MKLNLLLNWASACTHHLLALVLTNFVLHKYATTDTFFSNLLINWPLLFASFGWVKRDAFVNNHKSELNSTLYIDNPGAISRACDVAIGDVTLLFKYIFSKIQVTEDQNLNTSQMYGYVAVQSASSKTYLVIAPVPNLNALQRSAKGSFGSPAAQNETLKGVLDGHQPCIFSHPRPSFEPYVQYVPEIFCSSIFLITQFVSETRGIF
jgi:hypothetical protein